MKKDRIKPEIYFVLRDSIHTEDIIITTDEYKRLKKYIVVLFVGSLEECEKFVEKRKGGSIE